MDGSHGCSVYLYIKLPHSSLQVYRNTLCNTNIFKNSLNVKVQEIDTCFKIDYDEFTCILF